LTGNILTEWGQIILKHILKTPKLLPAFNDEFLGEMSVPIIRKSMHNFLKLITIKLMQVGVKSQTKLTWYNIPTGWEPPAWTDDSKLSVRSCRPTTSSSFRFSSRNTSNIWLCPVKICRSSRWLSDSNHSSNSVSLSFLAASGCSLWYLQHKCEYKSTT
jgi:hypothetical protein